jgi:hypothetical protein
MVETALSIPENPTGTSCFSSHQVIVDIGKKI